MEKEIFIQKTLDAFNKNGLESTINAEKAEKLCRFSDLLIEANSKFNLTAIKDDEGIILKHLVDCATVIKHIPEGSDLIDIGCGAGFPSMPIAILRDDLKVTSLDSTAKKINFINESAHTLEIRNIKAITSRAEDYAKLHRESFDIAISRAVARMNVLNELCIPLIKIGGRFIAMKSNKGDEEHTEAAKGTEILGAKLEATEQLHLQYGVEEITREIFVYKKFRPTPIQYPRNYSQITKKPL